MRTAQATMLSLAGIKPGSSTCEMRAAGAGGGRLGVGIRGLGIADRAQRCT